MKKLLAALGFAVLAFGFDAAIHDAQAQIANVNEAINKAGRQRMLSQRMAKAYLQVGQDIDADRSKKILDGSISLFDRQLVELKNFAPTPKSRTPTSTWSAPGLPTRTSWSAPSPARRPPDG